MTELFQSSAAWGFLILACLLCFLSASLLCWWYFQKKAKAMQQALTEKEVTIVSLRAQLEAQQQALHAEKRGLEDARNILFKDFELAAKKLFDSGQEKLTATGKQNLELVLNPFKEQLHAFNKRVEDIYHKENSQRNQLVGQITELQKQAQAISAEANNLATALKGENKTQGGWGEIILERLLEQSGLTKGREYETQNTYKNEAGRNLRPDVIIHLPDNKDIVIDSKVALTHFEAWSNSEEKEAREQYLKMHVEAIRSHIKGLSLKNYEGLEGVRTLDFVFLFMPIESAYVLALQHSPALFKEAYEKNIVLVSPSSLMVALRTVETIWRYEKQNKNAEAIAESAGRLYDQFVRVVESLDEVGRYIEKAGEAFEQSKKRMSSGRGNLFRRVEMLRELGAKASKRLATDAEDDAEGVEYDDMEMEALENGKPPGEKSAAEQKGKRSSQSKKKHKTEPTKSSEGQSFLFESSDEPD